MKNNKGIEQGKLNLSKYKTSENQSKRAIKRLRIEKDEAIKLEKDNWKIYYPTTVCDRIGIKNGKVYFIEFKKEGQELKPGQQEVKNLVKSKYKIYYYK
jgi:phage terminase large subunit-like protein